MIRRSPAERYIKYLLLHPKRYDTQGIIRICAYAQLDSIGVGYIERLRGGLKVPKDLTFTDDRDWRAVEYALMQGVHDLFFAKDVVAGAMRLLRAPRAKEYIEAMALLGAPVDATARIISTRKGVACTGEDIDVYCRYFWDLSLVDSTEARAILNQRWEHSPLTAKEDDGVMGSVKKASWLDPRRIAASMPSSPYTALVAQMRMGLMPKELDIRDTLEIANRVLSVRVLEAATGTGERDAERVAAYVSSMRQIQEIVDASSPPEAQLKKQLEMFRVNSTTDNLPTMAEVTGGDHTTQLLPEALLQGKPSDDDDQGEDDESGDEGDTDEI